MVGRCGRIASADVNDAITAAAAAAADGTATATVRLRGHRSNIADLAFQREIVAELLLTDAILVHHAWITGICGCG